MRGLKEEAGGWEWETKKEHERIVLLWFFERRWISDF